MDNRGERDLRLTVRRVIELLATYPNREELHQEFPELEDEDIRQSLIYANLTFNNVLETLTCNVSTFVLTFALALFLNRK